MLEMTGAASKIEGLLQVLRESQFEVLEVSRTGRMAMRRGHHTSRVLRALGTKSAEETSVAYPDRPVTDDLPNQFAEDEA
jgi:acetolactate synthase-1/3 small subunit